MADEPSVAEDCTVEADARKVEDDDQQKVIVGRTHPWFFICLLGVVLALIFAAVAKWLYVPEYEASALIQIRKSIPFLAFAPDNVDEKDGQRFVQTQIEFLKDPLVLGPVVGKSDIHQLPELAGSQDPILDLSEMLSVRAVGKSELYGIALRSTDPDAAADTVNAVVESYFNLIDADQTKLRQQTIDLLEEESDRRLKNIVRLREQLRKSAKEAGLSGKIFQDGEDSSLKHQPLDDLRERLAEAEVRKEDLDARIKILEYQTREPLQISEMMVRAEIEDNPLVKKLREQLVEKELLMMDLEFNEKEINRERAKRYAKGREVKDYNLPQIAELKNNIDYTERKLKRLFEMLTPQITGKLKAELASQREEQLAKLREEARRCSLMVKLYKEKFNEQLKALQDNSGDNMDLAFHVAELMRMEEVMERISSRTIALKTERRAPARVFKRRDARVPVEPIVEWPYIHMTVAALVGFCLPLIVARLLKVKSITYIKKRS